MPFADLSTNGGAVSRCGRYGGYAALYPPYISGETRPRIRQRQHPRDRAHGLRRFGLPKGFYVPIAANLLVARHELRAKFSRGGNYDAIGWVRVKHPRQRDRI
jgi:hypothetical protein